MIYMSKKWFLAGMLALLMLLCSVALADTAEVTASSLYLREKATSSSEALRLLRQGTKVEIIEKAGNWYKVTYGKYTGYVYADYVKVTADDTTLEKGDKGDAVKKLQERLKELGYFNNTCSGTYATTTVNAVKAFQKNNGLTADGIAGKATQNKLYATSAKNVDGKTLAQAEKEAAKANETLEKGDKGDAVKKLQERLKELGYFKNTCNGTYAASTVNAVKAFQKNNGLTQDGIAGKATQNKLYAASAKNVNGKTLAQAEKEAAEAAGTLEWGDKGDEVKKLQQRLKELGYFNNTCSGTYAVTTVNAVKAFQKKNGLTQDGIAGKATQNKLYAASAKNVDGKTLAQAEKDKNKVNSTLQKGDKGAEVKKLQERLKELGYYTGSINSSYNNATVEAVKAFQKRNSLSADGICGTATLRKLNSTSAVKNKAEEVKKDDGVLEKGDKGDEVKAVQERLQELGYYTDLCNGNFGSNTFNAVKAFQKNNGLTEDGRVTKATLNKLNSSNPTTSNGTKIVDLKTSQTLKHGDNNLQVKSLQNELKRLGYYTGTLTTNFGNGTKAAVTEFQRANKLTVNGVANAATLRKILSSTAVSKAQADAAAQAPKYKTERLDWFNGGRSKFAGRPVIEIKDVRTGLVFKGKVLYGENHLDVEPLTAEDTAILLKINGGVEFKWNRRPMLVKHNGHVYAASIYSEPHGEQTILNNNFDGQFCLHFYGSKTHGTDEVKQDHQNAIAEAMKATW